MLSAPDELAQRRAVRAGRGRRSGSTHRLRFVLLLFFRRDSARSNLQPAAHFSLILALGICSRAGAPVEQQPACASLSSHGTGGTHFSMAHSTWLWYLLRGFTLSPFWYLLHGKTCWFSSPFWYLFHSLPYRVRPANKQISTAHRLGQQRSVWRRAAPMGRALQNSTSQRTALRCFSCLRFLKEDFPSKRNSQKNTEYLNDTIARCQVTSFEKGIPLLESQAGNISQNTLS